MKTKKINQIGSLLGLVLFLFFTAIPIASSQPTAPGPPEQQSPVLVGRISHVDGQLLRYVPAEKDWVATVKDAPFGLEDALYSDEKSKAEFIMPNNTWVRSGGSTQIQMIRLEDDLTEMDVASGTTRFYNKSSNGVVKATTPFGYVVAGPLTTFDLHVGDKSVEVIALKGRVDYVHPGGDAKYEVMAGSSSILADSQQIGSGSGKPDAQWDEWNDSRDGLWSKRLEVTGDSKRYLPPSLHDEAYALEENGSWERVNYDGEYRYFWRPTRVRPGWAPYTEGRWTDWYGDNTWIPDEPFGYVTHHYGNWLYTNNFWYWAPPVVGITIGLPLPPLPLPLLPIPFGWFPGRVSWIFSGLFVGWVPLAPFEPYYCHHYWGPHCSQWDDYHPAHLDIGHYRYLDHAVMVHQNHFYGVNNYNNVRITNIDRGTIINNYRIEPVVSDRVIHNYTTNKQKYNFTDIGVIKKPPQAVLQRIERNQRIAGEAKPPRFIGPPVKEGETSHEEKTLPPRSIGPPVKREVQPEGQVRPAKPEKPGTMQPGRPVQPERGIKPPRPDEPTAPVQPERGIKPPRPDEPTQSGQPERPAPPMRKILSPRPEQPDTMHPVRPERPEQPGRPQQKALPPRPGEPTQSGQPERPAPPMRKILSPRPEQPDTMHPVRPERPEQPGKPGHGIESPGKSNQPRQGELQKTSRYRREVPAQRPVAREQQPQGKPQGQPGQRQQVERRAPRQSSGDFGQHSQARPQERQARSDSHSQSQSTGGGQPAQVQSQARSEKGNRSNYKD